MSKKSEFPDSVGQVFFLVTVVPLHVLSGFTISTLWGWFVVPLGVVAIGKAHAVGLAVLVGYVRADLRADDEPFTEAVVRRAMTITALAVLALAIGATVHGLMA